jgi:hypothetical protein
VVIRAVVEDLGDGVAREKPDAGILETAGSPHGFEHGRDLVTQPESITVQQLGGVEDFAHRLFVGPARDVVPESRFDEAPVSQEEAPDRFSTLTGRVRAGLAVDALGE